MVFRLSHLRCFPHKVPIELRIHGSPQNKKAVFRSSLGIRSILPSGLEPGKWKIYQKVLRYNMFSRFLKLLPLTPLILIPCSLAPYALLFTLYGLRSSSHLFKKVHRMTKIKEKYQRHDVKDPPVQGK